MADDCAYCPLLHAATALPAPLALVALQAIPEPEIAFAPAPRGGQRDPTGLGSRGPPTAA